jgi:hypothetical protein
MKQSEAFSNTKVVEFSFYRSLANLDNRVFRTALLSYSGDGTPPYFRDTGEFVLEADTVRQRLMLFITAYQTVRSSVNWLAIFPKYPRRNSSSWNPVKGAFTKSGINLRCDLKP